MNRTVLIAVLLVGLAVLAAIGYNLLNGGSPPETPPDAGEPAPEEAESPGSDAAQDASESVDAPPDTDADASTGETGERVIMGVVTDAATYEAVEGAVVATVWRGGGDDAPASAEAITDSAGAFELTADARITELTCEAGGYVSATENVEGKGEARVDFILQPGASLAGRVFDVETGEGIPSVNIHAYDPAASVMEIARSRNEMPSADTGTDGAFRIEGVEPGNYRLALRCRSEGYLPPEEPVIVQLEPRGNLDGVEIGLRRGGTVRGLITDSDGEAIEGISVSVLPANLFEELTGSGAGMERFAGYGETNDETREDGTYEIPGLDLGKELQLIARDDGYARASGGTFTVTASEPTAVIDVTMLRGSLVSGVVVDQNGAPAPGKGVLISPDGADLMEAGIPTMQFSRHVESDDKGRFEFEHVPPGAYSIRAGGFQTFRPAVTETEQRAATQIEVDGVTDLDGVQVTALSPAESEELALEEGVITGTVLKPDGTPAAGVPVRTQTGEIGPQGGRSAVSEQDGSFELDGLALGGSFELIAKGSAGWAKAQAQTGDSVTLRMSPPTRVAGVVLAPDGAYAEGCSIKLRRVDEESTNPMASIVRAMEGSRSDATTDAYGAFEIENAEPGRYAVYADSDRQGTGEIGPYDLRPGQQLEGLTITLVPGVTVSGTVTDQNGGPVSGAEVSLVAGGQEDVVRMVSSFAGGMLTQKEAVRTTDGSGSFTMDNVAPGTYELVASRGGFAPARREGVTVRAGSDIHGLDIRLSPGGGVGGRVLVDGEVKPGLRVMLMGEEGMRMASTDSEGRFSVSSLPEGSYMVAGLDFSQLTSGDPQNMNAFQPQVVDIVDGQMHELDLGPQGGAQVLGYVEGLTGNYSQVALRTPGGPDPSSLSLEDFNMETLIEMTRHQTAAASVNPDGSFNLDDVPPGEYVLEVYSMDMGEAMRDPFGFMQSGGNLPVAQQLVTVGEDGLNVNVVAGPPPTQ